MGAPKLYIGLSMESKVDDPFKTIESFNRKFILDQLQKDAVEWVWPKGIGSNMSAALNIYARTAAMHGLPSESSYRCQRSIGELFGMSN